jgi:hypothetical protein
MTSTTLPLKSILVQFLQGNPEISYPPIEARVLQFNPLQITDDYETYIDLSTMQDEVLDQVSDGDLGYKLILSSWRFVFRRVPNTHDYYFDIVSDSYRIVETNTLLELDTFPEKITDDDNVRYYFEWRKRQEIEDLIRKNMRIKTTPFKRGGLRLGTLSKAPEHKSPVFLKSPNPYSQRSQNQWTPNPYLNPNFTPIKKFFGGIQRSWAGESDFDQILSIEELLDVPRFIPKFKSVLKIPVKYSWDQNSPINSKYRLSEAKTDAGKESIKRVSEGLNEGDKSVPSLAGRTAAGVSVEDIDRALKSGVLSWDQVSFNRNAFSYLQKNIHLIEQGK